MVHEKSGKNLYLLIVEHSKVFNKDIILVFLVVNIWKNNGPAILGLEHCKIKSY